MAQRCYKKLSETTLDMSRLEVIINGSGSDGDEFMKLGGRKAFAGGGGMRDER